MITLISSYKTKLWSVIQEVQMVVLTAQQSRFRRLESGGGIKREKDVQNVVSSAPNISTVQWKWSPSSPGSLKALLFPPLLKNKVQNKGTQGLRARYSTELPPFISIVRHPGRPVMLGVDQWMQITLGEDFAIHLFGVLSWELQAWSASGASHGTCDSLMSWHRGASYIGS